jgi:hypothetical protein
VIDIAKNVNANLIIAMKETDLYGDEGFSLTSFSQKLINRSPVRVLSINVDKSIYNVS